MSIHKKDAPFLSDNVRDKARELEIDMMYPRFQIDTDLLAGIIDNSGATFETTYRYDHTGFRRSSVYMSVNTALNQSGDDILPTRAVDLYLPAINTMPLDVHPVSYRCDKVENVFDVAWSEYMSKVEVLAGGFKRGELVCFGSGMGVPLPRMANADEIFITPPRISKGVKSE